MKTCVTRRQEVYIMQVIVDGKLLTEDNIHDSIKEYMNNNSLVLNKVMVNDTEMVNITIEDVLSQKDKGQIITINTQSALELSDEALSFSVVYIPRLLDGLPSIRDSVLEGDLAKTKQLVEQAIEGLQWVILTAQAAASLYQNTNAITAFNAEIVKALPFFQDIELSVKHEDYTLTCDIFEYEITPFLEKTLQICAGLIDSQADKNCLAGPEVGDPHEC